MEKRFIKIRTVQISDYPACLPLLTLLYHGDIGADFKRTFEGIVKNEDCLVLLAEHSSKVIGILMGSFRLDIDWEGKVAKVDALIVDKDFRRAGIGRRLMNQLIAKAEAGGYKAVSSRINCKNKTAQCFHESLGFSRADTYEYILDLQKPSQ